MSSQTDTKREIEKLIERLEKATGRDKLLDMLIEAVALDWEVLAIGEDKHSGFVQLRTDEGNEIYRREIQGCYGATPYTASIDAKLPGEETAFVEITGPRRFLSIPMPVPNYWRAEMTFGDSPPHNTVVAWGATEPLARRAAALKARARMEADQ